jgi:hypothetical protein
MSLTPADLCCSGLGCILRLGCWVLTQAMRSVVFSLLCIDRTKYRRIQRGYSCTAVLGLVFEYEYSAACFDEINSIAEIGLSRRLY